MVETGYVNIVFSFIIPTFNEENCIRENIRAIKDNFPDYPCEIIVVDNGSTDLTAQIVQSENVHLVKRSKGTIASARNAGVLESEGQILVFLDADVLLTKVWQNEMDNVARELLEKPILITGSRCNVENKDNWLSRYWFCRMIHERPNYINSGHLITTRILFDRIRGFDGKLNTSKDYDFCMRAKKAGAEVINNPRLYVIHTGYPTSLKEFILRERWHGFEDFTTLRKICSSKVALVAILNSIMMVVLFSLALYKGSILYFILYVIAMFTISAVSCILKFGYGNFFLMMTSSIIFFFYYCGRSLALLDRLKKKFV